MPHFSWRGVNLRANLLRGNAAARNEMHLDALLFKRGIALLSCKQKKDFFQRPISSLLKVSCLTQLSALLESGILVPDALEIIALQTSHTNLQDKLFNMLNKIENGISLSEAIKQSALFDPLIVQFLVVGQESGQLSQACAAAGEYLSQQTIFWQKIKQALTMPAITFVFVCLVAGALFVFVIPVFADLFASFKQELPQTTRNILWISKFLHSSRGLATLIGIFIGIPFLVRILKKSHAVEKIIVRIPLCGAIIQKRTIAIVFHSLSSLMKNGMHRAPALDVIALSMKDNVFSQDIKTISVHVSAGRSLADALIQERFALFDDQIATLVSVAQESGEVADMLVRISHMYQEQVKQQLQKITILFQPIILLFLGGFVAWLVTALYLPILNMSQIVS